MRTLPLMLAMLLAACSQEPNNGMNMESEANLEAPAAGDFPIPGGGDRIPPDGNVDDGSSSPPDQNDSDPVPPPAGGDVTLAAAPSRASPGENMRLTLANRSRGSVLYNLCTSALLTSGGAAVPTDRICTMQLLTLEPGRSVSYRWELPDNLADGQYRFSTGLERAPSGGRITVRSNLFQVR